MRYIRVLPALFLGLAGILAEIPGSSARAQDVVISELQYHPHGDEAGDEFLEIENRGAETVDLTGWYFIDGIAFVFPAATVLAPGEALVISPDRERTIDRYPVDASRVIGNYTGRLENGGEIVHLVDSGGNSVFRVHYRDGGGWPGRPDGTGPSLELLREGWDPDVPDSWRTSASATGTPGEPTLANSSESGSRTLIAQGAPCKLFEGTEAPVAGLAWTTADFDDTEWADGVQPVGYGTDGVITEVPLMWGGYTTLYARFRFQLSGSEVDLLNESEANVVLGISYDDGFVAYLNDTEILRENAPGASGDPLPFDATATSSESGTRSVTLVGPAAGFRVGENVLALHGLNRSLFSGDFLLSAVMQLDAETISRAELRINEVKPADGGDVGFIELFNPDGMERDLEGYVLTDSPYRSDPTVLREGTTLTTFRAFAGDELTFALSPEPTVYLLLDPAGAIVDAFESAPASAEHSVARFPDGDSKCYSTDAPTEAAANAFTPEDRIVINEIHYHPGGDPDESLEFIELTNRSDSDVFLDGWRLSDAIGFDFPPGTTIGAGAYVVVAKNTTAFTDHYGLAGVLGPYTGGLANDEERINLRDALDNLADRVHYADDSAWPSEPDGDGPSLELLHPDLDNRYGTVWRVGPSGGTPGAANSQYRAEMAPHVAAVKHAPVIPSPAETVIVSCRVLDTGPVESVLLNWANDSLGGGDSASMLDDGQGADATAGDSIYTARIPAQPNDSTVRFEIVASDGGASHTAPGDGRFYLYEVNGAPIVQTGVPHYTILMTGSNWQVLRSRSRQSDV